MQEMEAEYTCERKLRWVYKWVSGWKGVVIQCYLVSLALVYVTTGWPLSDTVTCVHSSRTEEKGMWMDSSVCIGRASLLTSGSCWLKRVPGFAVGWLYLDLILCGHTVYWHFSDGCRGRNRTVKGMFKLCWRAAMARCCGVYSVVKTSRHSCFISCNFIYLYSVFPQTTEK